MTPEERFQENQKLVHFILQKKFPLVAFDEDVIQEANMGLSRPKKRGQRI